MLLISLQLKRTGQHGLRVPGDLSVIQILNDPMLEYIYPPVTRYILNRDKLCHAVVELALKVIQSGKSADTATMIPMFLVPGRSVAPPKAD